MARIRFGSLFYLILLLIVILFYLFHESVTRGRDNVIGASHGEVWGHLWSYFNDVGDLKALKPYRMISTVNYPSGMMWLTVDPLNKVFVWLFYLFTGSFPLSYNLLIIFHILLTIAGTTLLVREVVGSIEGGIISGSIVAFSPFLSGEVESGISESAGVGILTLFLFVANRFFKEDGWRFLPISIVMAVLMAFCGYYLLLCGLILFICFSAASFLNSRGKRRVRPLLLTAIFFLLLIAIFVLTPSPQIHRSHPPRIDYGKMERLESWRVNCGGGADLLNFFYPAGLDYKVRSEGGDHPPFIPLHLSYIGYSVLILFFIGIRNPVMKRYRLPLLVSLFISFTLSMGCELRVGGVYILPSYPRLISNYPPFIAINNYYRFHIASMIIIALFSGAGVSSILEYRWVARSARPVVASIILLIPYIEYSISGASPLPLSLSDAKSLPIYDRLDGIEGGVIDFPSSGKRTQIQKALYYQLFHRRPVANNPNMTGFSSLPGSKILSELDLSIKNGIPPSLSDKASWRLEKERDYLFEKGFRAIILHRDYIEETHLPLVEDILEKTFGEPIYSYRNEALYSIIP